MKEQMNKDKVYTQIKHQRKKIATLYIHTKFELTKKSGYQILGHKNELLNLLAMLNTSVMGKWK